jgi:hypothetical protein
MVRALVYHQTGPNSDLYSKNGRVLYIKNFRNIEISTNMATGDIEAHSDRPRCLCAGSKALGVGWDTPRSINVGHAPTKIILRPPRRHFMRKCVAIWGKFRLPSTEPLKNKTRVVRGGRGGSGMGGGGGEDASFFCPSPTHPRRCK